MFFDFEKPFLSLKMFFWNCKIFVVSQMLFEFENVFWVKKPLVKNGGYYGSCIWNISIKKDVVNSENILQ